MSFMVYTCARCGEEYTFGVVGTQLIGSPHLCSGEIERDEDYPNEITIDTKILGEKVQRALNTTPPRRSIDDWVQDVGPGWANLIRSVDANLRHMDPDYEIGQIKEKFGGLRYYLDKFAEEYHDQAYVLIQEAEALSFKTCEECGGPGTLAAWNGFWYKTLCPLCAKGEEK